MMITNDNELICHTRTHIATEEKNSPTNFVFAYRPVYIFLTLYQHGEVPNRITQTKQVGHTSPHS